LAGSEPIAPQRRCPGTLGVVGDPPWVWSSRPRCREPQPPRRAPERRESIGPGQKHVSLRTRAAVSRTRGRAPPYPRVSAIDTYGVCASPKGPWTRRAGGGILSNHANRSTNTALGSAADGCDVRPRLAPWIALRARRSRPEAAVRKLSPGEEANGREPRTDGGAGAVTAASWSRRSRRGLTQEGRRREPAPRRMAVNNRVRSPATILSPYTGASPAPPVPARASAPASRRPSSTR